MFRRGLNGLFVSCARTRIGVEPRIYLAQRFSQTDLGRLSIVAYGGDRSSGFSRAQPDKLARRSHISVPRACAGVAVSVDCGTVCVWGEIQNLAKAGVGFSTLQFRRGSCMGITTVRWTGDDLRAVARRGRSAVPRGKRMEVIRGSRGNKRRGGRRAYGEAGLIGS